MAREVDCHKGVLGLNSGGPKIVSPWNYLKFQGFTHLSFELPYVDNDINILRERTHNLSY